MNNRNKLTQWKILACLPVLFLSGGCGREHSTQGGAGVPLAAAPDKVSVRLLWLAQSQFAGVYIAKEKGFYRDANLDVDIQPGGPEFNPIKMLSTGTNTFAISDGIGVLQARSNGVPVVAVATIFKDTPHCFFARKSSGIKTVRDFAGKKVGIKFGTDTEYVYKAMASKAGLDRSKVKEIPIQFDMARFFSGELDVFSGYYINEPQIAKEKGIDVNVILPADVNVPLVGDCIVTMENTIQTRPSLVARFVKATVKGWEWAAKNQAEAVKIVLKQDPRNLKPIHEQFMLKAAVQLLRSKSAPTLPIGSIDVKAWAAMNKTLLEVKSLKRPTDVQTAYTTQFAGPAK